VSLTVTTWNINSVRLRIDLVTRFLAERQPDVLCLQETKCLDGQFPHADFRRLGYVHAAISGQKGYHGVAILSRLHFASQSTMSFCGKTDARHVCATLAGGHSIHNFYVPAGGDIPDPLENEKFAHKLAFLDEMRDWGSTARPTAGKAILVGDLNVAPLENDVWSHKQMIKVVSHTPIECAKLNAAREAGGWVDAMRQLIPESEKIYTWWSYRAADWALSDRGRRLDHVWVSPELAPTVQGLEILRDARGWERPSDHVPVTITLA
jgi:exodeoxyribonuclease-3